jgi:UDP-N-acetylmuramoylalanine--D-glutamate ligase
MKISFESTEDAAAPADFPLLAPHPANCQWHRHQEEGQKTRALVYGMGASGLAACRLLRSEGTVTWIIDDRDDDATRAAAARAAALGAWTELGIREPPGGGFNPIVFSPGIPLDRPIAAYYATSSFPVVSELELGASRFRGKIIAVTGSNGKSSVVKAVSEILTAAGHPAVACGNCGPPVCDAVLDNPGAEWLVVEASSFQLETTRAFRPAIAAVLNIVPNHLDRHKKFETYVTCKMGIFALQREGDTSILPDGPLVQRLLERARWAGACIPFSENTPIPDISGSYFDRGPLRASAAAIFAILRAAGIDDDAFVADRLRRFVPLPHRSTPAGREGPVRYVDDSKATDLAAVAGSVAMQAPDPVWLLAGGRLKETQLAAVLHGLRDRVRKAYLYGEAAEALAAAWSPELPCATFPGLEDAAEAARADALASGLPSCCVLLAPGCTSYDQYRSYGERGDHFQAWARKHLPPAPDP